ncbi:MAG: TldD/PmbA family protein [Oligoflexales bacterium]|nr:TldD/PmbA family protein [Oligoflexales bacterium]
MREGSSYFGTKDEKLIDLGEYALNHAKKLGADESKVLISQAQEKRLVVENNEFTTAMSDKAERLSVTVHKDFRKGTSSINSFSGKDSETAVRSAIEISGFSIVDNDLNFPDAALAPRAERLGFLYDENVKELSMDQIQETMSDILEIFRSDSRICIDRYEMTIDVLRNALLNSHGVRQIEDQTMVGWDFMGMTRDGTEVSSMDYDGGFSYKVEGYREKVLKDAQAFMKKILGNLKPRRCPIYKGALIFSPRAVESILLDCWLYHIEGRQVMDGKSRWKECVGKKVVSKQIALWDTPHVENLHGSTSFDDDGIPTKTMPVIENGRLLLHLHDCYTARKTGNIPKGTAGGPFAIHLKGGDVGIEDLCRYKKEILYVDRFSGNLDVLTGDFSGVAKSSRLIANGEDAHALTETMIAGNVFDISGKIIGISREEEIVSGFLRCPHVLLKGVEVSG